MATADVKKQSAFIAYLREDFLRPRAFRYFLTMIEYAGMQMFVLLSIFKFKIRFIEVSLCFWPAVYVVLVAEIQLFYTTT